MFLDLPSFSNTPLLTNPLSSPIVFDWEKPVCRWLSARVLHPFLIASTTAFCSPISKLGITRSFGTGKTSRNPIVKRVARPLRAKRRSSVDLQPRSWSGCGSELEPLSGRYDAKIDQRFQGFWKGLFKEMVAAAEKSGAGCCASVKLNRIRIIGSLGIEIR